MPSRSGVDASRRAAEEARPRRRGGETFHEVRIISSREKRRARHRAPGAPARAAGVEALDPNVPR